MVSLRDVFFIFEFDVTINYELSTMSYHCLSSSIQKPTTSDKSIDNTITLAYVPPEFQTVSHAPVAQPG